MKAFRFPLEALRTLRRRQEHVAIDRYAQASLARGQAMEKLAAVQAELNAAWHDLRARLAAGCPAATAAQAHEFHRSLEKLREERAAALGLAERRLNAAMQAMLAARQQREVVDKCFDKQKSLHERAQLREEQKLVDDLAWRRANSILSWNQTEALP